MNITKEKAAAHEDVSAKALYAVYAVLMLLLGLTVIVSYVPLGAFNIVGAFVIAFTKALLVLWFFMHLRSASRLDALIFGASLFMLAIASLLSFADYLTRS